MCCKHLSCILLHCAVSVFYFFFTHQSTPTIYTLSLHDALPICSPASRSVRLRRSPDARRSRTCSRVCGSKCAGTRGSRSEEHTSELQSLRHLVCRLLLEKKKKKI